MNESGTETGDAIARRLEWGQTRESLRAELLEDGLPDDLVDGLLYEERPPTRRMWPIRAIVGVAVSAAGFVVFPGLAFVLIYRLLTTPGTPREGGCLSGVVDLFFGLIFGFVTMVASVFLAFGFTQIVLTLSLTRRGDD